MTLDAWHTTSAAARGHVLEPILSPDELGHAWAYHDDQIVRFQICGGPESWPQHLEKDNALFWGAPWPPLDPDPRDGFYASPDAAADDWPALDDAARSLLHAHYPEHVDEHGAGLLQPFVDLAFGALLAVVAFWLGWFARGRSR